MHRGPQSSGSTLIYPYCIPSSLLTHFLKCHSDVGSSHPVLTLISFSHQPPSPLEVGFQSVRAWWRLTPSGVLTSQVGSGCKDRLQRPTDAGVDDFTRSLDLFRVLRFLTCRLETPVPASWGHGEGHTGGAFRCDSHGPCTQ